MKLLAHHELGGFGGMGEGMSVQQTADGRRILWMAHESAPKNFTGVDVTDPKNPKMVVQTELPHAKMRSNSLDVVGDIMAVAYQTQTVGLKPAGVDLFDISKPETPRLISHFDCSGPYSRGVHAVWFVDGHYLHMSSGSGDFQPRNQLDDQFYRILDVSNPAKPVEVGRWWYPGTREGDEAPPPERLTRNIKVVSHWNHSPPFNGFIHTLLPLFDRNLWIVSDECVQDNGADWPKLVWVIDSRNEKNPVPIGTFPAPPYDAFAKRGGRFGAHNLHENLPIPTSFCSDTLIIGSFFNAGVRVYDTTDPYQVQEVAYFVPGAPKLSPAGAIQLNDVFVDERRIVYTMDRFTGGLYILEMNV